MKEEKRETGKRERKVHREGEMGKWRKRKRCSFGVIEAKKTQLYMMKSDILNKDSYKNLGSCQFDSELYSKDHF